MSSKRAENYRRTTAKLLARERAVSDAKELFKGLTDVQRAELVEHLLFGIARNQPDGALGEYSARVAIHASSLKAQLLQRAMAGPSGAPAETQPPKGGTTNR